MISDKRNKLIRVTTVPLSLKVLLKHQLKFMSAHFEVVGVSSPGKMLEEVSTQEGIRTIPIDMTRSITPAKDAKALFQLYRLFKREKPVIIHTHTPKAGLLGMIAGRFANVPIRMHTVAGLPLMESKGIKRKVLEFTERLTYSAATNVYPNSKNLAKFIFKNKYCKEYKLKVLGNGSSNGIDTEFFQLTPVLITMANELKQNLLINENDFVFLFIGRLVKDKGIEELIEAFTRLKKRHDNIKLLLVGPFEPDLDPISEETKKLIKENDGIIHTGFQHDIRPYLAISHALSFPSYREGFPNVPMQAACFNLPCIVSDINGCNEIIEHGENGLIIPVKNAEALYEAMLLLMENKSLYQHLKSNARKMIIDRYEQKKLWNLLLEEYANQLKKHAIVS